MKKMAYFCFKVLLLWSIFSGCSYAELPVLIPRDDIFGNPAVMQVQISPDGSWYSYLAPSKSGVLNIWLQDVKFTQAPAMISNDTHRGIREYTWAKNSNSVLYFQDNAGDENTHVYQVNIADKITRDLTPYPGVRANDLMLNKDYPDEILLGLNLRDRTIFDIYRINLRSGLVTLDTRNPGDVTSWLPDAKFQIRAALTSNNEDGSSSLRVRENANSAWHTLITWPFGESGSPILFSQDGKKLTIESNLNADTSRLLTIDSLTGKILHVDVSDSRSDINDILIDPNERIVQAVQFNYLKPYWVVLDSNIKKDFTTLTKFQKGLFNIESRDMRDELWVVSYYSDTSPMEYYQFDRRNQQLKLLYVARPELKKYTLAPMKPMTLTTRDGLKLTAYLTFPLGVKPQNLPLILDVHGGPWARDSWGYNSEVQWLANRGYAVLQVNYRGSEGFGKQLLNAGNRQWGAAMQNDLSDAASWAIKAKIADPKKICIYGGSYGGYAVLAGLTFTPQLYACGVDIVGPSNLQTLLASIPPYWKTELKEMLLRIGDVDKDAVFNQKISPLFHAQNIRAPLLIAQGLNDPRVNVSQADSIVKTLRDKKINVTYVIYTDEGHGFARPENRLDFYGRAEEFLQSVLGGRAQPWQPVPGSSAKLMTK